MHDVDSRRLMFPGLAGLYRAAEPWGDLWLRLVPGGIMIPHSIPKLFGSFAPVLARNVLGRWAFPGRSIGRIS